MTAQSLLIKIILVGLVDALLIAAIARAWQAEWWLAVGFFVFALIAVNVVYFTGRALPFKYLLPGRAVPDRVPAVHDGVHRLRLVHELRQRPPRRPGVGDRDDRAHEHHPRRGCADLRPRAGRPRRRRGDVGHRSRVRRGLVGTNDGPRRRSPRATSSATATRSPASPATRRSTWRPSRRRVPGRLGRPGTADRRGGRDVPAGQLVLRRHPVAARLPLRRGPGRDGVGAHRRRVPVERRRSATSRTPTASASSPAGASASGSTTSRRCSATRRCDHRFLPILIWTFLFSIISTVLNFSLGLALALILRERRMRGKGIYRLLLIIPYGLPSSSRSSCGRACWTPTSASSTSSSAPTSGG